MVRIMNVTPKEFSCILEASILESSEFALRMVIMFGRSVLFEQNHLHIRRDVPSVPWFSREVLRYEALRCAVK
mgnify:CR=1 FL=1